MTTHIDKTTMLNTWNTLKIGVIALAITACGGENGSTATNTANPDVVEISHDGLLAQQSVNAVLWYNTSAEADYLIRQCYDLAALKLEKSLNSTHSHGVPAVILDLDETVLDNSPFEMGLIASNMTYTEGAWAEWANKGNADALPGAIEFARLCMERGVEVFYLSNRSIDYLRPTLSNLETLGFPNADPDHVMLKEGDDSDKSERRDIVGTNYNVVLMCGDNLRDFREDFRTREDDFGKGLVVEMGDELREKFVLFPNPMYGEWTRSFVDSDPTVEMNKKAQLIESLVSARSSQQEERR